MNEKGPLAFWIFLVERCQDVVAGRLGPDAVPAGRRGTSGHLVHRRARDVLRLEVLTGRPAPTPRDETALLLCGSIRLSRAWGAAPQEWLMDNFGTKVTARSTPVER